MKNLFLLLTVFTFSVTTIAQCIDNDLIDPDGVCILIYQPVCGCDGKTYSNLCFAQIQGGVTSYTYGTCPVTETYTICAGESVQIGLPGNIGNTAMSWSPTAGLSCTTCHNPIASPTSTTIYELKIFTTLDQSTTYYYYEVIVDPDPDCPCICPAIYAPVCGSDGITYGNECEAQCAGITEFYDGVCTDICSNGSIFSSTHKGTVGTADIPQSSAADIYCFNTPTSANICGWFWDFGNGTTSTEQNPADIYFPVISNAQPVTTPYEVCLTVYNCNNLELGTCCENFYPQSFSPCYLPPETGLCQAAILRWYYNVNQQDCLPFTYGGCGGNANNFTSYTACIDACDCYDPSLVDPTVICTADYTPVCGCDGNTYSNACAATNWYGISSYAPGECGCDYDAWYTVPDCNSCIESVQIIQFNGQQYIAFWGDNTQCADAISTVYNCDGTVFCYEGGFAGFTQCSDAGLIGNYTVLNTTWSQNVDCDICNLPPEVGPCDAVIPRWYYNAAQQDCLPFTYGGCGGNANNFETYNACIAACNCYDPTLVDPSILCPAIYQPVCGCDGKTYSNACAATNWYGISAYTPGECVCDYSSWYTEPNCNSCVESVQIIQFNGTKYIAFWGDNNQCADAITTIYNCDGSVFCYEEGFAGFTQCSDVGLIANYTVLNTLWQSEDDCSTCDYQDWLTKPTCDDCYASVEKIVFNGNPYIAFWQSNYTGSGATCSDQISIVYHCDGSVFCYEGGIAGFTQCSDAGLIGSYTTLDNIWSQHLECGICALPPDPGICLAYIPRWYYNAAEGECQQFIWGGCGGNANNFTTFEVCMDACSSFTVCPPVLNLAANPLSSGAYQAEVTTISNGSVLPGHNVILRAGANVELKNGFSIPKNCNVKIDISPCN